MKSFCLVLALVLTVYAVCVNAGYCAGPNDSRNCHWDECCVKRRWPRIGYKCEDKGDKINERCGGEYTCGCVPGLICVPGGNNFFNYFREGTGSCQQIGYRYG